MKKKFFRLICCLIMACSMFAFSGCGAIFYLLPFGGDDDSSEKSYASNEWNPNEDALNSNVFTDNSENNASSESSANGANGGGSYENSSYESSMPLPQPNIPNEYKELVREETDELGHKIAYYTDGTCEDLGRVIPLEFIPVAPIEKEGYQYFSGLEKANGLCDFYQEILTVAYNFHRSGKDVISSDEHYRIAEMSFSQHGLTKDEAVSVWHVVSLEYPEFFWWGNTVLLGKTSLDFLIDPLYAQASTRAAAQTAIEKMVYDCDKYMDGTTTKVERALTLHDYVAQKIEYAYQSDGVTPQDDIWAHNLAGGAQYGKGVCESYAKTYDYLCERFNLSCITVPGFASENGSSYGHAWNVVQIDGSWYNVDITWDDIGVDLGGTSLSREWFGTNLDEFSETHEAFSPADGWNVDFMFALPTLHREGLTPVRAAKVADIDSGKYTKDTAPMYPSIEAVCDEISEGIIYESYLYPKTKATGSNTSITTQDAELRRVTHTAGTLVINGAYRALLGGYYELTDLTSTEEITFLGDVVLRDVAYTASKINLGGNTLTTEGSVVEIVTTGFINNGNLTDKTIKWTDVTAVALDTVSAQGKELRLLGGGTMSKVNIFSGVLRLNGTQTVSIGTLWYATANERLYVDEVTNATRITVGDIIAGIAANEEAGTTAVEPSQVTIFVAYTTAKDYPIISVENKTTTAKLCLTMHSDFASPQTLGRSFINLGQTISLSDLKVVYSRTGYALEIPQTSLIKQANGDVCWSNKAV